MQKHAASKLHMGFIQCKVQEVLSLDSFLDRCSSIDSSFDLFLDWCSISTAAETFPEKIFLFLAVATLEPLTPVPVFFFLSLFVALPRLFQSFPTTTRSVWEALRQSACPMELRVDLRAVCAGLVAQRARISERFAFLTKRKVEARQGGGAGVGAGSSAGRVVTL